MRPGPDERAATAAFDTRQGFIEAVRQAVATALAQRARRMVWSDADFDDWPLDDAALLQGLVDWLHLPQRRLQLLVVDGERLRRRHARFMDCYRMWSHAIDARAPAPDDAARLPCLLLVEGGAVVQVHDKPRWRGSSSVDKARGAAQALEIDAFLQRSEPTLPPTILGL